MARAAAKSELHSESEVHGRCISSNARGVEMHGTYMGDAQRGVCVDDGD